MQRGLYPRMDAMMQAVQWYLLKSITVEISIANFDSTGNKKWTDRVSRVGTFPVCFSLELGKISSNLFYIIRNLAF
jgi:polyphosphate kinase